MFCCWLKKGFADGAIKGGGAGAGGKKDWFVGWPNTGFIWFAMNWLGKILDAGASGLYKLISLLCHCTDLLALA